MKVGVMGGIFHYAIPSLSQSVDHFTKIIRQRDPTIKVINKN